MNGLLPTQFEERIGEPSTRSEAWEPFWEAIVQARKTRRDDLVAIDEEAYAEPLVTALFLFRKNQPKYRQLVLSAQRSIDHRRIPRLRDALLSPRLGSVVLLQRDQIPTFVAGINDHKVFVQDWRGAGGILVRIVAAERAPLFPAVMAERENTGRAEQNIDTRFVNRRGTGCVSCLRSSPGRERVLF